MLTYSFSLYGHQQKSATHINPVQEVHPRANRQKHLASPSRLTCPWSNSCRCKGQKGEDDAECKFYQKAYRSICPGTVHGPQRCLPCNVQCYLLRDLHCSGVDAERYLQVKLDSSECCSPVELDLKCIALRQ